MIFTFSVTESLKRLCFCSGTVPLIHFHVPPPLAPTIAKWQLISTVVHHNLVHFVLVWSHENNISGFSRAKMFYQSSTRQRFWNLFTQQAGSQCVEAHSVAVANLSASIVLEPLVIDPVGHVVNSTSLSWFSNNSYFFTSWSGSSSLCPRLQFITKLKNTFRRSSIV